MDALENFLAEEKGNNEKSRHFADQTPTTEEVNRWITQLVKKYDILVFSKSTCTFCLRAKRLLTTFLDMTGLEIPVHVVELNSVDAAIVQPVLKTMTRQTTVPNIFLQHKHIGGYDALCAHFKNIVQQL